MGGTPGEGSPRHQVHPVREEELSAPHQRADAGWGWSALAFALLGLPLAFDLAEDAADGAPLHHLVVECCAVALAALGLALAMHRLALGRAAATAEAAAATAHAVAATVEAADAREAAERARTDAAEASNAAAAAREDALTAAALADAARREAESLGEQLARAERLRAEADSFRLGTRGATAIVSTAIAEQLRRWELSAAEMEVARLLLLGLSHREIGLARSTTEHTARDQAQAVYKKAGVAGRAELSAFFLEDLLPVGEG